MNQLKKKDKSKKERKVSRSLIDILNGNILARNAVLKHLPYLLFLALLALVYIANGYFAQDTIIQLNHTDVDLKELRSEYITTKSDLMYNSKPSEVAKLITEKELGLRESYEPPQKIVVTENEQGD